MKEENKVFLKENFNIDVDELTTEELKVQLEKIIKRKNEIINLKITILELLEESLNNLN